LVTSNNNNITDNTASENSDGIHLSDSSNHNIIMDNTANSNTKNHGIWLWESCNNTVTNNTANENNEGGICLDFSDNNTVTNNTANENNHSGVQLFQESCNNTVTNNIANLNNDSGICLQDFSNYNAITDNAASENSESGICLDNSSDNLIYNNYFNNTNNALDDGTNTWNISKTTGTNIIGGSWLGGNFWSDYTGTDTNGDGIGNTMLPYDSSGGIQNGGDWLPLVKPSVFDTGAGTYPSISGIHNGTITPNVDIAIDMIYTYPCAGTGGHTKYAAFSYTNGTLIAEAYWNGYVGDWYNISFSESFTLHANETYNYTIRTGSYPQIIHEPSKDVTGGTITCDEFTDVNGNVYTDWIPAIRLE